MELNLAQKFRITDEPEIFYTLDGGADLTLKELLRICLRNPSQNATVKETRKRYILLKKIKLSDGNTIDLDLKKISFLRDCLLPTLMPDVLGQAWAMLDGNDLSDIVNYHKFIAIDNSEDNNLFE